MAKDSKSIRIPCNSKLKEYNTNHLTEIAAMSVNDVYTSLSSSGGIITSKCTACNKLLSTLINKVNKFGPSVPMMQDDQHKIAKLKNMWMIHLQSELAAVSRPVKPTYLRDTVTQILHTKNYDGNCQNIHLEWYLAQHNSNDLDPQKIADAIITHKGTNWQEVPHLVHDDYYYVRLQADDRLLQSPTRGRGKYDDILNVIEFIESFPATPGIDSLEARLKNDIEVVNEMQTWRESQVKDYEYKVRLQRLIDRLQTLPSAAREIIFAKIDEETLKKLTKMKPAAKRKGKKISRRAKTDTQKVKAGVGENGDASITTEEPASVITDDDPGVGSESFFSEGAERIKDDPYKENRSLLLSLLNGKVRTFSLIQNGYIDAIAKRSDFKDVYSTLVVNYSRPGVDASAIMQFINNVVQHGITEWGTPAPSH